MDLGFHKMLGNYGVAAQLVASRVALSSIWLVFMRRPSGIDRGHLGAVRVSHDCQRTTNDEALTVLVVWAVITVYA
jgi:hypothetical protein